MNRRATGLRAWVLQRATAIYMLVLFPCLIIHFTFFAPESYEAWRSWIAQPLISIFLSLGLLSILLHAWVGVRDIFLDYVHQLSVRLVLLTFTAFGLIACGTWGLQLILLAKIQ